MARRIDYSESKAREDAEDILRRVMKRRNFGSVVRDELAAALERIVQREAA